MLCLSLIQNKKRFSLEIKIYVISEKEKLIKSFEEKIRLKQFYLIHNLNWTDKNWRYSVLIELFMNRIFNFILREWNIMESIQDSLRRKINVLWTYKLRDVKRKLNVKGRRYPKRVYDISLSDDKEHKTYDEEEDTEQHRLYFQSYWREVGEQILLIIFSFDRIRFVGRERLHHLTSICVDFRNLCRVLMNHVFCRRPPISSRKDIIARWTSVSYSYRWEKTSTVL